MTAAPSADYLSLKNKYECLVYGGEYVASSSCGLKHCPACSSITADTKLSDSEFSALDGGNYFVGEEFRNHVSEEASLKDNFLRRIVTLAELIPGLEKKDVFEVGCAYGFFLDEVKDRVKSAQGIDIAVEGTRHGRDVLGVDAITGNYIDREPARKVELVAMWDTIEHLPRPDLSIAKASEHVLPGGRIAVTTGDFGSLNDRVRGKRWRMIHPPTHLHYFSVKTLRKRLDAHGFDVVHVSHPGNARDLRSILHFILDLRLGWSRLYQLITKWRIFNLSMSLDLFDIMFVVARRRES